MIKVLDKSVSDKIAAGEVIERPLSIVKELVENAVDSGADSIICEIKNGGKSYIRVTDNGSGIPYDEAELAFLRHATSKIEKAKDLDSIETLGFRGEALASICAVSQTEMITKIRDSKTGVRLVYRGGRVFTKDQTGCPDGTTIVVTDLFYNTPARAKFLKSDSAEASLIIDFISRMALAYKDIKFRLINNDKILFSTLGDGNRFKTILRVYPSVDQKHMVPLEYEEEGMYIEGYISTPAFSKTSRSQQIFFVNGRSVDSKVMERGVTFGYRERLFEGRYPVCFLFLRVDPQTLDVNIHPNKREVRLDEEGKVAEFIGRAISNALSSKEAVVNASDAVYNRMEKMEGLPSFVRNDRSAGDLFTNKSSKPKDEGQQVDIKSILQKKDNKPEIPPTWETLRAPDIPPVAEPKKTPDIIRTPDPIKTPEPFKMPPADPVDDFEFKFDESKITAPVDSTKSVSLREASEKRLGLQDQKTPIEIYSPLLKPFDFNDLWVTGCIFDTYITATDDDSFYLIDQHAAQERVFYEKLVGEYEAGEKVRQTIMVPLIINVDYSQLENSNEWIDTLTEMGFTIEEFGGNAFRITEIPMFMEIGEADEFIRVFLANTKIGTGMRNTVVINKLIMMSCKAAIKAHDKLSLNEMKALLKDLANCRNPFSCPHGRPTAIKLTQYDLEKMFKRVQ
ncbi:MAG: DNA mismatch repair endonuclease MutL [Firmicutes bacterium]|nr:DNA mismatch repair endonuclease MutL [Bacillota bacterium]